MNVREERIMTVFTTPRELRAIADKLEEKCRDPAKIWGKTTVVAIWGDDKFLAKAQIAADQGSLHGINLSKPWT